MKILKTSLTSAFIGILLITGLAVIILTGCYQDRQPRISIQTSEFDFGPVDEGIEISHNFAIENRGDAPLKIIKAESSCGCTVPTVKDKTIAPGGIGEVRVTVDTAMKQGLIRKEVKITSNDPLQPVISMFVNMTVKDPHTGLSAQGKAKIFTGRCAVCHVDQGIGKMGEDLYLADCAMCHGFNAEGAVGPALTPRNYHDKNVREYTIAVTSQGSRTHPSMPGFLKSAGGPLTAKEIASIIAYLRWHSDNLH